MNEIAANVNTADDDSPARFCLCRSDQRSDTSDSRRRVTAGDCEYPETDAMVWFFDRNGERLRYEISRSRQDGRYRLVITRPDGSESVEEVDEPTVLVARSAEVMNALIGDGWRVA